MADLPTTPNPSRPLKSLHLPQLRERIGTIRRELSKRSSKGARRLRAEIDPEYASNVKRDCCVYVIELSDEVCKEKRFMRLNPDSERVRECLYVGSTSKTPRNRLQEHQAGGKKASVGPRDYGIRLRSEFTVGLSGLTRDEAETLERRLATTLRSSGYGVWQG